MMDERHRPVGRDEGDPDDEDLTVDHAAAIWAVRRHDGLNEAEATAFAEWLAADPAHERALAAMEASFDRVSAMPPERVARLNRGGTEGAGLRASEPARVTRPSPTARRSAVLAAGLTAAVGAWWWLPALRGGTDHRIDRSTGRGELADIDLPDGSRIALDAMSSVSIRYVDDRREVIQHRGRGHYTVSPDPARPFVVKASPVEVTVTGTRFAIDLRAGGLGRGPGPDEGGGRSDAAQAAREAAAAATVAVASGSVSVRLTVVGASGRKASDGPLRLAAGEQLLVSGDHTGPVRRVAPQGVAPWREGRVVFDDTPLALVLEEVARYVGTDLFIADPKVAAMRFGGSFEIRRLNELPEVLPRLLPVRLMRRDGRIEIVRR